MRLWALQSTLIALALAACGDDPEGPGTENPPSDTAVTSVVITPASAMLASLGETVQLQATATSRGGRTISGKTFVWTSSNESSATVSSVGLVTAMANGSATVAAAVDGVSGDATVEVLQTATGLRFLVEPTTTLIGDAIAPAVEVAVVDALGSTVVERTDSVQISHVPLTYVSTLRGSHVAKAVKGIATFVDLSLTMAGPYRLVASTPAFPVDSSVPFDISIRLQTVAVGPVHTCGLLEDGRAVCWGRTNEGQVGDSVTQVKGWGFHPILVADEIAFASLTLGDSFSCGLTPFGYAYCWGVNGGGQLGTSTIGTNSFRPVAVEGGHTLETIQAGGAHVCGLAGDGSAYCWGANDWGQLGDGTGINQTAPVAVAGGLQFKMIGAGSAVTCGVTTANEAYCWGDNLWGTVGDSSTVDRWVPTRVSGGHVFTSVVVGGSRACALDQNGAVYCWGSNHTGELGVVTADPAVTTPIPVASGFSFDSLVTGTLHTCGWDQAGDVRCWGHNGLGELGDGSTEQRLSPVLIAGGRFATLSCGYRHACGIGVDGYAYCWGSNQYGRLGTGTDTSPILTPALVLGQQ